jgi:hypothetical protein
MMLETVEISVKNELFLTQDGGWRGRAGKKEEEEAACCGCSCFFKVLFQVAE